MNGQQIFKMLPVEEAAKLLGRGPVSSLPYYDPGRWELERQAIFMRSWLHVGHICEIPESGSFIRREIEFAHASLLIIRGKDGEIRAFHNACTHRGTQLADEVSGKRSRFSCRYHMWTFGLDGALVSAPDFERFHVAKEDCSLKQVQAQVLAGMIFINFDPAPKQSIREFLGPIADALELTPVARAVDFTEWTYEIEANWKTSFDNYQENYHLRVIHPRTGRPVLGPENPFGYPTHYGFCGPHRSQTLWKNPSPPPTPPIQLMSFLRGAALAEKDDVAFPKSDFKLFPCLHIVGLPPNQFTHTHMPLGPTRTRGQIRMYWTSKADSASRQFVREMAAMSVRDVLAEDRVAIEACQRGVGSGAIDRFHFQDHEILLRHLYEEVEARVEAYVSERARTGGSQ
ncbi:aromatic ring-hydroxylating dioxygenase subunit alpha [Phenylobacterium sp. LjRoot225]|uniref:aromatic ring-hydroxylating oxygenase subunit alpha n=1 Tax=Phenylobacterium sp. LjRoot225 TaxID=3342285 RepID=UPI003ECCF490